MTAATMPVAGDLERFLDVVWQPGDVREVRIIGPRGADSGYFDDTGKLMKAVTAYDGRENVYVTINPVAPALLARAANRIVTRARTTTSDVDIVERRWLPIDLDPKRPSGISASHDEREHALATARAIYSYLHERDWPDPVTAMSGNGYWLLYPIELPNDEPSKQLVEGALGHLATTFGSPAVSIDTTVGNAARIVALIGTMKVKGDATTERPHRRSALTYRPPSLDIVSPRQLAALSSPKITVARPFLNVGRMPPGWVKKALDDKGVAYREVSRKGRSWYLLSQCPFHPDDDQGGDCGVGEDGEGKGLGHCFHNRGAGKGWQDFKSALGIETNLVPFPVARPVPEQPAMRGMDAADLLELDLPPLKWIVPDLVPEGTTILAAPPKVGKSCLIYQIAVEASIGGSLLERRVTPGSVLYMALEDGRRRGQDRLRAVLAGRTMPRGRLEVRWSAPAIGQGLEEEIAAWLDDHPDAVMVAIDTLGKVRPPGGGGKNRNAYEVDVEHLNRLQALFRDRPVALLIVHHSSKEKRDDFLASVSGTYGITGSADTIMAVERKRSEAFGQIHVTGRDAPDISVSVRFDGLLWQSAPDVVTEGRFERSEVYRVIEEQGPIFPTAIAGELGKDRSSVHRMVDAMVTAGAVMRTTRGYEVARIDITAFSDTNTTPDSGISGGGQSRGRAGAPSRTHARARGGLSPNTNTTPDSGISGGGHTRAGAGPREGTWAAPCRDYASHQTSHHKTPAGWVCDICNEGASA